MTDNTTIPPRPTTLTDEMKKHSALVVVEELLSGGHIKADQFDDAVSDIAKRGRRGMDGYELAKDLDQWEDWDCDLEMAQILDGWSSAVDSEIKAAQADWAKLHDIQPPFPNGARVMARWGGELHAGTIAEVYRYGVAQYAVKADSEKGTGRMIVNFEHVELLEAATAEVPA